MTHTQEVELAYKEGCSAAWRQGPLLAGAAATLLMLLPSILSQPWHHWPRIMTPLTTH